jgi:nucleotide-binding universal stress UspA family protein
MFRKILVPLDGSANAEQAIPVAIAIARGARAAIDLLRVHQPLQIQVVKAFQELEHANWHAENEALDILAEETRRTVDVPVTHAVLSGDPATVICSRALDEGSDLVVMTSHGRTGFSRAWLGSVADAVVRRAAVPVLMLRSAEAFDEHARTAPRFGRILVPLDGSSTAAMVLEPAAALARSGDATLVLLRVVQPVPMASVPPMGFAGGAVVEDEAATHLLARQAKGDLETAARELAELGVTAVERHVIVEPGVGRAILDFANRHRVDLIAMTSHGRGASRLVIGSIADKLLRGSSLPILLRRPALQGADRPLVEPGEIEQQLAAIAGN